MRRIATLDLPVVQNCYSLTVYFSRFEIRIPDSFHFITSSHEVHDSGHIAYSNAGEMHQR
jgi:hypothetical protein